MNVAPLVAVWETQIFSGLVEEGISEAQDAAVGWAMSQLGLEEEDPSAEITAELEALDKKIDQLQGSLDASNQKNVRTS